jgi:hypothetical protein
LRHRGRATRSSAVGHDRHPRDPEALGERIGAHHVVLVENLRSTDAATLAGGLEGTLIALSLAVAGRSAGIRQRLDLELAGAIDLECEATRLAASLVAMQDAP